MTPPGIRAAGQHRIKTRAEAHQMAPPGELRTKRLRHALSSSAGGQFRHFPIKLIRQEADIVIVGLKRALNLATLKICLILSKDSELRIAGRCNVSIFSSGRRRSCRPGPNRFLNKSSWSMQEHHLKFLNRLAVAEPGPRRNTASRRTDGQGCNQNLPIGLKPTRLHGDQRGRRKRSSETCRCRLS